MKIGFLGSGHLSKNTQMAALKKGFATTSIRFCDIVYIAPDRPSDEDPQVLVDYAITEMRKDAILVIHCQVEPGFTRQVKWPKSQLFYHVETLIVSSDTTDRALNPERIILGTDGYYPPQSLYDFLRAFQCPIFRMSYESAELAKIAINVYLAAQVSTTNTLSEIAQKTGADWNDIIPALQTDKRIGKYAYLKPGYGLSKHLLRDLNAINKIGGNTSVTDAFLEHSKYRENQL